MSADLPANFPILGWLGYSLRFAASIAARNLPAVLLCDRTARPFGLDQLDGEPPSQLQPDNRLFTVTTVFRLVDSKRLANLSFQVSSGETGAMLGVAHKTRRAKSRGDRLAGC
jgi:hypothetical protein